jgi:tyrosine-protein kinase Etk/Wzc
MTIDSQNSAKTAVEKEDDEIDLMALLLALLRGWKTILFFAILGLLIGILYSRYVNPTYKSEALIQIDEKSSGISALGGDISELIGAEDSKAQAEAELIRSRMVLEPVINSLNLRIRLADPEVGAIDRIVNDRTNTAIHTPEGVSLTTTDGQVSISQFNVSQGYLNQPFTLIRSETGFTLSNNLDEFKGQLNQPHQFKGADGQIQITVNDLPDNSHAVSLTKQSLQKTTNTINSALSVVERVSRLVLLNCP